MKVKIVILYFLLGLFLLACNNKPEEKFKKLSSGLEYRIVETKGESARKVSLGDILQLNYSYETEDGRVLFASSKSNRKYLRKVDKSAKTHGSIEDGFLILKEGDSAVFRLQAEKFLQFSEGFEKLPKGVQANDRIIVKLRVIDIVDRDEYDGILLDSYHKDKETEMEILQKFLINSNINVKPTESGLYYLEQIKGNGPKAEKGKTVTVHYTVKYIDGELIESSIEGQPISFVLGKGQVIPGWEEGITYMHQGGKAMLIVPSHLAYGDRGNEKIRPFATLVFEVELINVK